MKQYSNLKNVQNRAGLKNPMSRGILILISFLFIVFVGNAQTNEKYDKVFDLSDGLRLVKQGDKYGYVDETGKEVVSVKYNAAKAFSFGYALVKLEDKFYLINKTGQEFSYKFLDKQEMELYRIEVNEKIGYFDMKTYKLVTPIKYSYAGTFSEGFAPVRDGQVGFIDETGKEIIQCKYDRVGDFQEGLAEVALNKKSGYIDKTGKEVIPLKYRYANNFSEGLARVNLNGKWGYIDKVGNEVIPLLKYDEVGGYREGLIYVKLNGKYGYVDKTDKMIIPFKYDDAYSFCEGLAAVKLNGKWGFIDKTDKVIISFKYDEVSYDNSQKVVRGFENGFARVELGYERFYIDKNGNKLTDKKVDKKVKVDDYDKWGNYIEWEWR